VCIVERLGYPDEKWSKPIRDVQAMTPCDDCKKQCPYPPGGVGLWARRGYCPFADLPKAIVAQKGKRSGQQKGRKVKEGR